jgi:hypothetical protein
MTTRRLRANRNIENAITRALAAADLERCSIDQEHQDAMRQYLQTWVAQPLRDALSQMRGERMYERYTPPPPPLQRSNGDPVA